MTKLAIGIPWQHQFMPTDFLFSLWDTDIPRDAKLIRGKEMDLPNSRIDMVCRARDWGADEIFVVDVDQGFPSDVLARLRSHDKDIISGWSPKRGYPHFPLVYRKVPGGYRPLHPAKGLQKVDGFGFGCVLMKMHIFDKIPAPWFLNTHNPDTGKRTEGNDFYFCNKAQEAGFELWVDNDVNCTHDFHGKIDKNYALATYAHLQEQDDETRRLMEEAKKKEEVPNTGIIPPKKEIILAR
jgi:hypothetical protein